jgi:hypothetical protein
MGHAATEIGCAAFPLLTYLPMLPKYQEGIYQNCTASTTATATTEAVQILRRR